jgi:hypothetical protein
LLLCPASAPQLQPATQSAAVLQFVVQTLPVQAASPAGWPPTGWPTGRQMPVVQSAFLLQGVPASPAVGCTQTPPPQVRLPSQTLPPQQAWPTPPQAATVLVAPPLLELLPLTLLAAPLELPPLELELDAPMQVPEAG